MPDITEPIIVQFVGADIRPRAENIRAIKHLIDDLLVRWFSIITVNPAWTGAVGSDEIITEGTGAILTKDDVTNFVAELQTLQTQLDLPGAMDVITKPTVRPLEATVSL